MNKTMIVAAALAAAVAAAPITTHASKVGAPAPDFRGTDSKGKVHNLSDFKGKWVVLEWHNEGCPYVRKHYGGNNMQKLQQEWPAKGVVWLTILSSAAGQQGHMQPAQADAYFAQKNAAPSAILLDRATPIYEDFPGWQEPIHDVRSLGDLPENARRYVTALEDHAGVPIVFVSVGPERTQTIERAWRPMRHRPGLPA